MTMNPFNPPYTGGAPFAVPVPNGREITGYLTDEGAQEIVQLLTLDHAQPESLYLERPAQGRRRKAHGAKPHLGKEVERLRAIIAEHAPHRLTGD